MGGIGTAGMNLSLRQKVCNICVDYEENENCGSIPVGVSCAVYGGVL